MSLHRCAHGVLRSLGHRTPASATCLRSRSRGLTCVARRTKSGGGDKDTKRSSTASSSSRTASGRRTPSSRDSSSSSSGKVSKQHISQLEQFMRETPVVNRFLDGTLILGDAVMLIATEASSERIPVEQIPALAGVAVTSWIIAGAALGDYAMEPGQ